MKPFNELTAEEQKARRQEMESLFTTRKLTPEEKKRAEEKKQRNMPSIGEQLIYIIKAEAKTTTQEQIKASPEFQTGKKVKAGGKKGHVAKHGDSDAKQTRWAQWQTYIDSRHKQFLTHSFNALTKAAAKNFGVSQRTIFRHCKNPANTK